MKEKNTNKFKIIEKLILDLKEDKIKYKNAYDFLIKDEESKFFSSSYLNFYLKEELDFSNYNKNIIILKINIKDFYSIKTKREKKEKLKNSFDLIKTIFKNYKIFRINKEEFIVVTFETEKTKFQNIMETYALIFDFSIISISKKTKNLIEKIKGI